MSEFNREKVIPEIDAIHFARMAESRGEHGGGDLHHPAAGVRRPAARGECMEDNGVQLSGCILYCTSKYKGLLRKAQPYRMGRGRLRTARSTPSTTCASASSRRAAS